MSEIVSGFIVSPLVSFVDVTAARAYCTSTPFGSNLSATLDAFHRGKVSIRATCKIATYSYASTLLAANYGKQHHDSPFLQFTTTSLVYSTTNAWRDTCYRRLFCRAFRTPLSTQSALLLLLRDMTTIYNSFLWRREEVSLAQWIQAAMLAQVVSTPLHILAVDPRLRAVLVNYKSVLVIRTLGAPALAIGGWLNQTIYASLQRSE
jgi:uncharacterized membrane protein YfcA